MSNTLQQIEDSLKRNLSRRTIVLSALIMLLTSTLLFGLGYLSGMSSERAPIIIQASQ